MNKRSLLPFILVSLLAFGSCKKREEPLLSIPIPPITSQDSGDSSQDAVVNTVDHVENLDPISSVDPEETQASEILVRIAELNEKLDEAGLLGTRRAIAIVGLQHDLKFEEFLAPYFEEYQKLKDDILDIELSDSDQTEYESLKLRVETIQTIVPAFMSEIRTYESHKEFLKKVGIEIIQDEDGEFKVQDRFVFVESHDLKLARFNQYLIPTEERINYNKLLGEYRTKIMLMGGLSHQARPILELIPTPGPTLIVDGFDYSTLYEPTLKDFRYRNLKVEDGDFAVDQLGEVQHILREFISKFDRPMSEERKEKENKLLQFVVDLTLNAMIIEKDLIITSEIKAGDFTELLVNDNNSVTLLELNKSINFSQSLAMIEQLPSYFSKLANEKKVRSISTNLLNLFIEQNPRIQIYKAHEELIYFQQL